MLTGSTWSFFVHDGHHHTRGECRVSQDPEVKKLAITTTRAYAIAERLADELDKTVTTLESFIREKPPAFEAYPKGGPHE